MSTVGRSVPATGAALLNRSEIAGMKSGHPVRVTFAVYDCPDNVCGPASWIERLLPELQGYGIDASCVALCWQASGPLVRQLRTSGIPVLETICRGTNAVVVSGRLDPADAAVEIGKAAAQALENSTAKRSA